MADDQPLSDDNSPDHPARQRLEVLDALATALDRRVEVMDTIASSPSAEAARIRLVELLGISANGAQAVLDLQWRRFAQLERHRITDERDQLRRELERSGNP